ncbi:MAG: 26S proteasome regulatory subunit N9 [Lasallia pustulata]|uniref:26S proteasome regulatory subunit N9 n=1 Tax=Lasallia pustulata TaxID=136370 RepID=A0A5M8PIB9_9LECA|nr:MAG: 26S proteasome regulatory subunit N9 [Lasallia pustulata]
MDPEVISNFLSEQREVAPEDLQASFLTIEDYWERKLWHQLTDVLVDFFSDPASASQRLPLFQRFIWSFSEKINQLKFVALGLLAATQCSDDHERLTFLTTLAEKVNKPSSQDAYVYALVAASDVKLRLSDYDGARKDLDKAESILDTFDSVETEVHATFYRINATYYQAKLDFAAYYKNALLYLACIDLKTLNRQESESRAYDLSVAALISDSIYNFGELLLHPILDSLTNTEHAWLRELLFAFNRGDLAAYNVLENNLSKSKILEEHKTFLWQKISLSALTEAVFRRPPHDRAMTFATISNETNVQPQEIEILIMKALSLGLLKGSIDQVAEIARINWVQPKVLDMKQIDNMRLRLKDWDSSVNQLGNWIEGVGKDVWAA